MKVFAGKKYFKRGLEIIGTLAFIAALIGFAILTGGNEVEGNKDNYFYAHSADPEGFRDRMQNKCLSYVSAPDEKIYCECTSEAIMQLPRAEFNEVTGKLFDTGLTNDDYRGIAKECSGLL